MKVWQLGSVVVIAVLIGLALVVFSPWHQARPQSCVSSGGEAPIGALQSASNDLVPPPTGETGNATGITESLATLHGEVTPNGEETTVSFQYGPTPDYGSKTADVAVGSAHVGVPSSADLTGLVPGTTYHYQEVIETPTHLLYGAGETFATHAGAGAPPSSTPQPASVAASEPRAASKPCP